MFVTVDLNIFIVFGFLFLHRSDGTNAMISDIRNLRQFHCSLQIIIILPEKSPVSKSGYKYKSYTSGFTVVGSLYLDMSSGVSVVVSGAAVVTLFKSSISDLKSAFSTPRTIVDIPKATVAAIRKHRSL